MHQESSASQGQTYPPLGGRTQVRTGAKTGSICAHKSGSPKINRIDQGRIIGRRLRAIDAFPHRPTLKHFVRRRLEQFDARAALIREAKRLFVVAAHCPEFMRTIPVLPRDKKNPDTAPKAPATDLATQLSATG